MENNSNSNLCWNIVNGRSITGQWGSIAVLYERVNREEHYFFWKKRGNLSKLYVDSPYTAVRQRQASQEGERCEFPFIPTAVHNGIAARLEDFFTEIELAEWRVANNIMFRVLFHYNAWRFQKSSVPIFIATKKKRSRRPWKIIKEAHKYKDPFKLSEVLGIQVGSYTESIKRSRLPIILQVKDHGQKVKRTFQ